MSQKRERVVRDPLYDYVPIPARLEFFVDHPLMQRLRNISQTSFASTVYPSMTGSRFEHSLGTMFLARRAWDCLIRNATYEPNSDTKRKFLQAVQDDLGNILKISGDDELCEFVENLKHDKLSKLIRDSLCLVALLHDVGHTPFSHALEPFYEEYWDTPIKGENEPTLEQLRKTFGAKRKIHELFGCTLAQEMLDELKGRPGIDVDTRLFIELSKQLYVLHEESTPEWAKALHSIVDGEIDVDRLDYIMRDSQRAGAEFGAIDYKRLVESIEIHAHPKVNEKWLVGYGLRAQSAVESLLVQRLQAYRWILFHPRVVACDLFVLRSMQMLMILRNNAPARIQNTLKKMHPQSELNYLTDANPEPEHPTVNVQQDGSRELAHLGEPARQQYQRERRRPIANDATILSWLRDSLPITEDYIAKGPSSGRSNDYTTNAKRFLSYYDTLLLRRKNTYVAWKRFNTYKVFAERAYDELTGGILGSENSENGKTEQLAVLDDLQYQYQDAKEHPNAQRTIKDARDAVTAARYFTVDADTPNENSVRNPTGLLHCVAQLAVGDNGIRFSEELTAISRNKLHLTPEFSGEVFWEITLRGFKAVETEWDQTRIFQEGEAFHLTDISELARSLQNSENHRIKLFTYLVFATKIDMRNEFHLPESTLQEEVRKFLENELPKLLIKHYREALEQKIVRGKPYVP